MSRLPSEREIEQIRFYYVKGAQFRVVHVDGGLGGITPRGLVHLSTYSERPAIPQVTEHQISPEGLLSDPISQEGKSGIVRDIDVDLMMSKRTAKELGEWLLERVAELDEHELLSNSTPAIKRKRKK